MKADGQSRRITSYTALIRQKILDNSSCWQEQEWKSVGSAARTGSYAKSQRHMQECTKICKSLQELLNKDWIAGGLGGLLSTNSMKFVLCATWMHDGIDFGICISSDSENLERFCGLGLDQCERYGFTWEWFGHGTWAGRETLELGSTVWVWDLASQKRCHISDAKKLYEKVCSKERHYTDCTWLY